MSIDIRISVDFWCHPKTTKLERRLGLGAVKSLTILWMWSASNQPDGNFKGLDDEDIEIAAQWNGEPGIFVKTLLALKWLDENDGHYSIHDWLEHNPWAAEAESRSNAARFSKLAQVNKEAYDELQRRCIKSLSEAEYYQWKNYHARIAPSAPTANADETLSVSSAKNSEELAPVPSLTPLPNPQSEREDSQESTHRESTFHNPTLEEVNAYCRERGNSIDGKDFVTYYASKDWRIRGKPIRNWKSVVNTWEKRNREPDTSLPPHYCAKQNLTIVSKATIGGAENGSENCEKHGRSFKTFDMSRFNNAIDLFDENKCESIATG